MSDPVNRVAKKKLRGVVWIKDKGLLVRWTLDDKTLQFAIDAPPVGDAQIVRLALDEVARSGVDSAIAVKMPVEVADRSPMKCNSTEVLT